MKKHEFLKDPAVDAAMYNLKAALEHSMKKAGNNLGFLVIVAESTDGTNATTGLARVGCTCSECMQVAVHQIIKADQQASAVRGAIGHNKPSQMH